MCNKNETNEISEVMRKNGFDLLSLTRVLFWKAVNVKKLIIFRLILLFTFRAKTYIKRCGFRMA